MFNATTFHAEISNASGVQLMVGCASSSPEGSLASALELASDPRGYAHHAVLGIVVEAICDCCKGHGKIQKRRGKKLIPYAWNECKACKGQGTMPVLSSRVVQSPT